MGNLHSVQLAFRRLNKSLDLVKTPTDLKKCDALILPGVGAFDPAMENLERTHLVPDLKIWAEQDKPLLGICLGLQLFFESSDEGSSAGLGLLKGHVQRLPINKKERIPHMGWAPLEQKNESPLLNSFDQNNWMYFVHSYAAKPIKERDLAATVTFGDTKITAIVWRSRIGACQFHPEKSSLAGQRMLNRWLKWLEDGAEPLQIA